MDAIHALQLKQTAVENEYNILVHDVGVLEAEVKAKQDACLKMEGDKTDLQIDVGVAQQELQNEKQKLQQIEIAFDRITIEEELQQQNLTLVVNDALELQRKFVAESTKLNKEIQSLCKHMLQKNFWVKETNYLAEKIEELTRNRVECVRAKQAMWEMEMSNLEKQVTAMVEVETADEVQQFIAPRVVADAGTQSVVAERSPPLLPLPPPSSLPAEYIEDFYAADTNTMPIQQRQDVAWYRDLTKRSRPFG